MNWRLGVFFNSSGAMLSLDDRLPEPRITESRARICWSTYIGMSSGRAKGVTPPIIMPVTSRVSSGDAKDTLDTSIKPLTA